jgi:hypothetical protein
MHMNFQKMYSYLITFDLTSDRVDAIAITDEVPATVR